MRESNTKLSLSLTYKSLKTGQPSYLHSLLSLPSHRCTRSSSLITLSRPSLTPRLKIANRSFYHSAPVFWNNYNYYITIKVSKMTKVTSQALFKKNIEIKENKKKINKSSDDFKDSKGRWRDDVLWKMVPYTWRSDRKWPITHGRKASSTNGQYIWRCRAKSASR